jgi:hypothetical protein
MHESSEVGLVGSQQHRELADQLTAQRARHRSPHAERAAGTVNRLIDGCCCGYSPEGLPGDRGARREFAVGDETRSTAGAQCSFGEFGQAG